MNMNRCFTKEGVQITNEHIGRNLTAWAVGEMQIKTTIWYHFKPIKWLEWEKPNNTKHWPEHRAVRTLIHCWRECKWYCHSENGLPVSDEIANTVSTGPSVLKHSIYPREPNTYVYTKICMWIFVMSKNCKQSR